MLSRYPPGHYVSTLPIDSVRASAGFAGWDIPNGQDHDNELRQQRNQLESDIRVLE